MHQGYASWTQLPHVMYITVVTDNNSMLLCTSGVTPQYSTIFNPRLFVALNGGEDMGTKETVFEWYDRVCKENLFALRALQMKLGQLNAEEKE